MPKASRRQKLTKEELREENARIKQELSTTTDAESQQRILDLLSKENWIAYLLTAFLPPVGIWYIWAKRNKHHLTFPAMITWSFVGIIITWQWVVLAIEHFS